MGKIFYSAAAGGFFHEANHPDLPADAVRVSALRHRQLIEGQATGRAIVTSDKGQPLLAPAKAPNAEQLRKRAVADLQAEASRRIYAVASIEQQSNDNAAIALAALAAAQGTTAPEGLTNALVRRSAIDALRTACNHAADLIARMPAANLTHFDATAERLWVEG